MEITVYRNSDDLMKNKFLLRSIISSPDCFDFMNCVNMFKNMFPQSVVVFRSV